MDSQTSPIGHAPIGDRKPTGAHYTPRLLAQFVAKQLVDAATGAELARPIHILDPACGDGELLLNALNEYSSRNIADIHVHGFDTDRSAVALAQERIGQSFPHLQSQILIQDFLEYTLWNGAGGLFRDPETPLFDLVIANPPYVRTQVLGAKRARKIARQFGLTGRVDLYHAFLLAISKVIRGDGIAAVIVSNRFMTTRAGEKVRAEIASSFDVLHVWDLGDTRLFEAAVLPAVLLLRKKVAGEAGVRSRFTSIYSSNAKESDHIAQDVITALELSGKVQTADGSIFEVHHGRLHQDPGAGGRWRLQNSQFESFLNTVADNTFLTFADIGKVRVGIKSNADGVFVREDWDELAGEEQPELLRPIITHHIARRYKSDPEIPTKRVLYPHVNIGGKRKAVNLQDYPNSARYLERHKARLEGRAYLINGGRAWYEIWVPQDPEGWALPKVVFRDITEAPTFWMDMSGSVVNGDCYWLAADGEDKDHLLWLALAVGNSTFIEAYYDRRFHNKLYAGRRRFMTQYVAKFPLPDPAASLSEEIVRLTRRVYGLLPDGDTQSVEAAIDEMVWRSFGLRVEEVSREMDL